MNRVIALAFVAACAAGFPHAARGQEVAADEVRPRALVDSVFAARLELDMIAEMIRRGSVDSRRISDTQLAGAARRLAAAAATRPQRKAPHASLGGAWDFQFDSVSLTADGPHVLRVRARALLSTDPGGGAPVTLIFQRKGAAWRLDKHEGLVGQLTAQAQRIARGEAK